MQDLVLKLTSIFLSVLMLSVVYVQIEPQTYLEIIGTLALLVIPFKLLTKRSYKFWKEI